MYCLRSSFIMKPAVFIALWLIEQALSSPLETVPNNRSSICSSNECYKTAHTLLSNMNIFVDPCEDFYEVRCWSLLV